MAPKPNSRNKNKRLKRKNLKIAFIIANALRPNPCIHGKNLVIYGVLCDFLMAVLVQNCEKARVFGIFWGTAIGQNFTKARDLRQKMRKGDHPKFQKHVFYG